MVAHTYTETRPASSSDFTDSHPLDDILNRVTAKRRSRLHHADNTAHSSRHNGMADTMVLAPSEGAAHDINAHLLGSSPNHLSSGDYPKPALQDYGDALHIARSCSPGSGGRASRAVLGGRQAAHSSPGRSLHAAVRSQLDVSPPPGAPQRPPHSHIVPLHERSGVHRHKGTRLQALASVEAPVAPDRQTSPHLPPLPQRKGVQNRAALPLADTAPLLQAPPDSGSSSSRPNASDPLLDDLFIQHLDDAGAVRGNRKATRFHRGNSPSSSARPGRRRTAQQARTELSAAAMQAQLAVQALAEVQEQQQYHEQEQQQQLPVSEPSRVARASTLPHAPPPAAYPGGAASAAEWTHAQLCQGWRYDAETGHCRTLDGRRYLKVARGAHRAKTAAAVAHALRADQRIVVGASGTPSGLLALLVVRQAAQYLEERDGASLEFSPSFQRPTSVNKYGSTTVHRLDVRLTPGRPRLPLTGEAPPLQLRSATPLDASYELLSQVQQQGGASLLVRFPADASLALQAGAIASSKLQQRGQRPLSVQLGAVEEHTSNGMRTRLLLHVHASANGAPPEPQRAQQQQQPSRLP